ncbi:efflux RND transporter periplasmic adaptor subunit [Cupriavidus metallidurans]|uniref:efflux RND transporter periplasmic adaptor subunit n=1 Tax=Cupriavidus metallidurans TaxID=119219 RepID=UPI000564ECC4|nr:efflux RND transporter periplasmic adaptor subunit [Cupriavidus metallidurans]
MRVSSQRLPVVILGAIAVAILAGCAFFRVSRASQLQQSNASQLVPVVSVIHPTAAREQVIELPGRIEAWSSAPIYARVSGYVKRWNTDIGAPVKAGQVLAEIETPDLDQSLKQAQAELQRARSDATLARTSANRWQALLKSDSVSRQEVEERTADAQAREAQVAALQANVERNEALQQYKRLVAPFDGLVTARNTDVGALINVGMSRGNELFVVSDTRRLRIYVNVPQRQISSIREGATAEVVVPERPQHTFKAVVQSMAQAIDAGSGTMRIQLNVDNANGELFPGAFATVRFTSPAARGRLSLPPSALIVGRNGVQVATVEDGDTTRLQDVTITRDAGSFVELAPGLRAADLVIDSPPDGISTGDRVRLARQADGSAK